MHQVAERAGGRVDERGAAQLSRYLLDDETLVAVVHQHWARVGGTVACVVIGFALVIAIGLVAPASAGALSNAAWWLWFAQVAYLLAILWQWRREWFIATDRRLLLTYGIITHKVAMMPMAKVTDMSFNRSVLGRMIGYGSFVMESAGQDQAMHRIDYIPEPDETYRAICHQIFGERGVHAAGGSLGHDSDLEPGTDHDWDEEDPTDVPFHRYGAYLPPEPTRTTRLRHRLLRRPRPSGDKPLEFYESDQGWTVSHEDAASPQRVHYRRRRSPDDPA